MYLPIFVETENKPILVVGAGNIALSKLELISEYSKDITVIADWFNEETLKFIKKHKLKSVKTKYHEKYLEDKAIIIAATNDDKVNLQIHKDAKKRNLLVNLVDNPKYCDFIFGAVVKRGKVSIAISSNGISPVLSRIIKQKIEKLLPFNLNSLTQFIAKNREKVKNKLKSLQARRLFWQDVVDGAISEEVLAGNDGKAQKLIDKKLANSENRETGAVYFIGAGPGDPELITLKAIRLISKADVILYDRLASQDLLDFARKEALKINVGKTRDFHKYTQEQINKLIKSYALKGEIVVRLKGGDTAIFAHLASEIDTIKTLDIPYQIIPGITAASGAAASLGVALTHRKKASAVKFLTLYKENLIDDNYWNSIAKSNDSLVFYMSSHNIDIVTKKLIEFGRKKSTPIIAIEQATTPYQQEFASDLENFSHKYKNKNFKSPTLIIIGDTLEDYKNYAWRDLNEKQGYYFLNLKKEENV